MQTEVFYKTLFIFSQHTCG